MSGAAIVRQLLAQDPVVGALVPANQIRAGIVPQGTAMPAIGVHTISESEEGTMSRRYPQKLMRERVQVTVYGGADYAMMKKLMKATALGPGTHRGNVVGFDVRSVMPWGVGPEIPPGDDKIYEQSRDFMVTFVEAN